MADNDVLTVGSFQTDFCFGIAPIHVPSSNQPGLDSVELGTSLLNGRFGADALSASQIVISSDSKEGSE